MSRFAVVLLLAFSGLYTFAQTPSASVTGRVTDPSGAIIPGVSIRVTNLETSQISKAGSNDAGDYTVPYLTPGSWSLEAESAGFRLFQLAKFTLEVDQALRVDVKLEIGTVGDAVTITDTPPVLNTESGARGDVTTNQEITELPLSGRNFGDLAYLTGGVVPKGEDGDGAYAINGARADNVGFTIDGMNNTQRRNTGSMVSPPLEGVQEFKLTTSGFSAEFGRYSGGVLSAVMKSGGNRLRGSLYEFIRNDVIDARNFFDLGKSKLRRNQFGATLSGPVVLPKIYNGKNRTFFLFTWESIRQVSGSTQRGITPLPEMLQGDFSRATDAFGKPLRITDPLAKAPFPNNQIPASRLDPIAQKMAAYYPKPNLSGSANNYIAQANSTSEVDNFGFKVDHSFSQQDRLTFSGYYRPSTSTNPFTRSPIPIFGTTSTQPGMLAGIRYLRTFTPSLFNEASMNVSRTTLNQGWPDNKRDWASEIGFVGPTKDPVALGLPYIDVSGYVILGHAYDLPKIWAWNNFQYADSMTWIRGAHTFKFGGDFLRYQYFNKSYGDLKGRMTFLGRFTGEPMADFVLGYAQTSRRAVDVGREYMLVSNYSAFLQDDYKVTRSLTLNIGLRYELLKQPVEKYGARSMFVPQLGKVVLAGNGGQPNVQQLIDSTGLAQYVIFAADAGLPPSIVKTRYNNFAPRFGFAWRPFGNNKSVIRGGYGLFYGSTSLYRYDDLTDIFPFSINESYSATTSNPLLLTVSNPYPPSRRSVGGITSTSGQNVNDKDQYLQTFSLTFEREFAGTVVEVAYSGSKGTHLPRRYDINQPLRQLDVRQANGSFPRPFPAFSTINVFANISNSIYNSGSITVRRPLSKGLFVRFAYVYSKSIDETSNTGGVIAAGFPTAQDSRNLHLERGRSDFDVGHSVLASFIWTPKLTRNYFLKDWQLAGTTRAYTGAPYTLKLANYSLDSGEAIRPDRIASGKLANPSPDAWYDRTAFLSVPPGSYRFGNSGRNILDGPGTFTFDTSLSRRFRVTERTAFQLRGECFNISNRTNFSLPKTQIDVLNAGTISQAKAPRLFQLGLRLEF